MSKIKQLKGYVNYSEILDKMEKTVKKVSENIKYEEIWFLEHKEVFTAGSSTPKEFNEEKINNMISERNKARKEKDFHLADKIRDELKSIGVSIEDKTNETKWRLD